MRTFIAITIDEWMRDQLMRVQDELKAADAAVRWVPPENIHLTLKFLGRTPDDLMSEVADRMRRCCADIEPFTMLVRGLGAFPTAARPRVVVAVAEAPDELYELNRRLEEVAKDLGLGRQERRFKAHLTLGRVKGPRGKDRLAEMIEEMDDRTFGEMEVKEVVFMMSELSPAGAQYTPLARVPLGS